MRPKSPIRSIWIPDDLYNFFSITRRRGEGFSGIVSLSQVAYDLPEFQELRLFMKQRPNRLSPSSGYCDGYVDLYETLKNFHRQPKGSPT